MTRVPDLEDYSWTFYIAVMIASVVFAGMMVYGVEALNTALQANSAAVETEYVCGVHCQGPSLAAWDRFRALVFMIGVSFGVVALAQRWRVHGQE